jgi:hypothetical protein
MVYFDYMAPGHLQMLYVKSKYSTYVLASTKLGQQSWGCTLSLLTMFTEEVKPFLNNVICKPFSFAYLGDVHSHIS